MANHIERKLGWIRDIPDHRDYRYIARPEVVAVLPSSADLRSSDTPILDQGNLGSCTAHAAVAVFEWLQQNKTGKYFAGSRLFIYKESRDIDGVTGDQGATIRSTAKSLAQMGVPPEIMWPYIESKYDIEPSAAIKAEAIKAEATNYYRLDGSTNTTTLNNIKAAAGSVGLPAMIGFTCYDSIFDVGTDGMIPLPVGNERPAGGHAVATMGYSDAKQALLIKNSWSTTWGMSGYGWLPYWYVSTGLVGDCWVIAAESEINPTPTPGKIPTSIILEVK